MHLGLSTKVNLASPLFTEDSHDQIKTFRISKIKTFRVRPGLDVPAVLKTEDSQDQILVLAFR